MSEELDQIDVSHVEKLVEIKTEQDKLHGLIEQAGARREKVSAAVFERVVKDFEKRIDTLEQEARPLRKQAHGELKKLQATHGQMKADLDKAKLDKEETEFRHEIGELPDEKYEKQHQSDEELLSGCNTAFDAAEALRQRFLEVIPEQEPEEPAPPPPKPKPTPAPEPAAKPEAKPEPTPPPAGDDADKTMFEPTGEDGGLDGVYGTMAVPLARLVEQKPDGEGTSYSLATSTSVGRTKENDIALEVREISRRHARIDLTDQGFTVTDLKSGNGTFVNGKKIKESPLSAGDKVQFGSLTFIFHTE
jgi:hypothetical protein